MSLVVDNHDPDVAQLHAFIVGVGGYPHLAAPNHRLPPDVGRLSQLSSPPFTANSVSRWFEREYRNDRVPLGSIELLISPNDAGDFSYQNAAGQATAVDRATMDNIWQAYQDWFDRCNAQRGNIAVFYFCGHGILKDQTDSLLLSEDFAKDRDYLSAAINFTLSVNALRECNAATQILVADACQEYSRTAARAPGGGNAKILYLDTGQSPQPRNLVSFNAAVPTTRAFARPDSRTRFGDAFLQSLGGLASENKGNDDWVVTLDKLVESVKKLIAYGNTLPEAEEQVPGGLWEGQNIELHQLEGPPDVTVRLACIPNAAVRSAELQFNNLLGTVAANPASHPAGWNVELAADSYQVTARFPSGDFDEGVCRILAIPPLPGEVELRCGDE